MAKGLKLTEHAASRANGLGITRAVIDHVLKSGQRIKYVENGVKKVGIYSRKNQIFIPTAGNRVLTIFNKVTSQYIKNVSKRR